MAEAQHSRVTVDGKFLRLGGSKFFLKGITYGPFTPGEHGGFAGPEQTVRDFGIIRELGANTVRVYSQPPRWLLDLALERDLKLLIDIPWNKQNCFLDTRHDREEVCATVRKAVRAGAGHPAVLAFSIGNEIAPDIVRWSGARAVAEFLDELALIAKNIDPQCLCTYGNFPPTEFLRLDNTDFTCFNVYLHEQKPFENYLARLQMIADTKPLVLGEFGIDTLREGEKAKSRMLEWQVESVFRSGLAGAIVYSFTDDWHKDGCQIEDWAFGLTTADRQPKRSFCAVQKQFAMAPCFPLDRSPKVSVVVACYNGVRTLKTCLESLQRLNYPDYEVILVDDGSTDGSAQIASAWEHVRVVRHARNEGLSVARNTGIGAATGEIVAFTDADCRADEDWLYFLVSDLLKNSYAGIGGHNLLPKEDSAVAAAVMASPGGPTHVMLDDREAEHIPGCNMAFYKWALEAIDGFEPVFRTAGDDVDICWRLQQQGWKLGFSPAGFVWHYRRSTVRDYLRQQSGYGEAEALLARRHPEYFNKLGSSIWRGRIYAQSKVGVTLGRPIVYHGLFSSGLFQTLYAAEPAFALMMCTSLEYYVLITLPLAVLSAPFPALVPLAIASLLLPTGVCAVAACQAEIPKNKRRFWSRPLVGLLFFLQPIWRGVARYKGRLSVHSTPLARYESFESFERKDKEESLKTTAYRADGWVDRLEFLRAVTARLEEQGWQFRSDSGWCEFDLDIVGSRWSRLQLTTVAEANQTVLRCRLQPRWSLTARLAFWGALGIQCVIIGLVAHLFPWIWLLLLTLPLFGWLIERQQRDLQRLIAVVLDELAEEQKLAKIESKSK